MSHAYDSSDLEREIEIGIVSAFGWSVIEFEAVLFQKFLVMSGPTSLITEDMFRQYLRNMEAKGYVSRERVHGERAFRRLLAEEDLPQSILPRAPLDEMHLVIGSLKARRKEKSRSTPVIQWSPLTEETT